MKRMNIYIVLCLIFFWGILVFAQAETNQKIPEGMEAVQIGGSATLIVPQGAKTRKVGAQIIVEGTKEYMSRRFLEVDERLTTLEKNLTDLTKEVAALKNDLKSGQK